MTEADAIKQMVAPGTPRPGKYRQGVIQIHLTRACDKSCFNCTQGSNLAGKTTFISPELFEKALISLEGYWGVVGIFGGNPALHPQFSDLCLLLQKYFPFEQRGLWCNHPHGKGRIMRETFDPAVSNLNVHLDRQAYDEFKRDWPESRPFGLEQDSRHSPAHVAMQDVISDEGERWKLISNCDINKHWSAMLCVIRGQLRAYFCEIAGAQAILHQDNLDIPDLGLPALPGWWRKPMEEFADQVRFHCHRCGVPLRGHGELAMRPDAEGVEQTSRTHESVYRPKRKDRKVELVVVRGQLGKPLERMTDYLGNAK